MNDFDYEVKQIEETLKEREKTGVKLPMSESHGDFVKYCVIKGKVKVLWVDSAKNIADVMTKPLPAPSHKNLRDIILNNE